ncbi:MAG: hypothetical protein ABL921_28295 [Pirellula sp.]
MSSVKEEFEMFTEFARNHAADARSLDELYDRWRDQYYRDVDARAIEASLADMLAGETGRPLDEFAAEFRKRNSLESKFASG